MITGHCSRPIRSIAERLSILLAAIWAVTPAFAAEAQSQPEQGHEVPALHFHPPTIEAERVLVQIIELSLRDHRIYDFMINRRGAREKLHGLFGIYFSQGVLEAIAALERTWVKKECGGKYIQGDNCGFGFDPLFCAQESPDSGYFFAEEMQGDGQAVIAMSWAEDHPAIGRYRMVKRNGQWQVDAIDCVYEKHKFNW
jgi:hypothetical protein